MKKINNEYATLSKRFDIDYGEFKQYYNLVRMSRKKTNRLYKQGNAIYIPKYSLSIEGIKTREDFNKRYENIISFLSRDWRAVKNKNIRENFNKNLRETYGKNADIIIEKLNKMSDREFIRFFDENDDITLWQFYARDFADYAELIDLTFEKFLARF